MPLEYREGDRIAAIGTFTRLWAGHLKNHDSILYKGKSFIFPTKRLDWLWDPTNCLFSGYQGLFTLGQSGQSVTLTTFSTPSVEYESRWRYTSTHACARAYTHTAFMTCTCNLPCYITEVGGI